MNRDVWELLVSLGVRIIIGVCVGEALALAAYFVTLLFILPGGVELSTSLTIITFAVGIGGGVGGFVGWVKLDQGLRDNLLPLTLTLMGGMIGAWGGLLYARVVIDAELVSQSVRLTAAIGAGIAANIPPVAAGIFIHLRGRGGNEIVVPRGSLTSPRHRVAGPRPPGRS